MGRFSPGDSGRGDYFWGDSEPHPYLIWFLSSSVFTRGKKSKPTTKFLGHLLIFYILQYLLTL